jgi:hypothetical protein
VRCSYRRSLADEQPETLRAWTWVETPHREVPAHAFFEITYASGEVEEIEAQECLEMG